MNIESGELKNISSKDAFYAACFAYDALIASDPKDTNTSEKAYDDFYDALNRYRTINENNFSTKDSFSPKFINIIK